MMQAGGLPHVLAAPATDPTLSDFNQLIWWMVLLKVAIVFLFLLLTTMFMIWAERRVIGRMQNRPGPNRAGPFGLLQPIADALKLPLKEDIIPPGADKLVFIAAPVISGAIAFISFSVIPWGPEVSIFHHHTPLQLADLPVAVLLILAMSSIGVYGIVLAGWSSGSPYSLLGALRSAAQVISYEIAMGLAFVAVFLYAGSLSTTAIVNAQQHEWYAWLLPVSFVIYLVTMVGETNRLPFDLPEGEGELVAGYHTEYSSMKFAMFYLAEYINMITVSALATTLFLGGWRAPWPLSLWSGANSGWWPLLWFLIKVFILLFCYIWLRGTLPRVRYDQLMAIGWKVLIPVSIVWILLIATVRAWRLDTHSTAPYVVFGFVIVLILVLVWMWDSAAQQRAARYAAAETADVARPAGRRARTGIPGAADGPAALPRRRSRGSLDRYQRKPPAGRSQVLDFLNPIKGFGVTFQRDVQEGRDRLVPGGKAADRAAVPRSPPAQPVAGRAGEMHRLRAVRLGLPGGRHLRRGPGQHRGGQVLPRRAVRGRLPDQLPALHPVRHVHRGLPDPRADHDQRVRDRRRQPGKPDLDEGAAARAAAAGHGGAAASDAPGRRREGLLPPRRGRPDVGPRAPGMAGPGGPSGPPVSATSPDASLAWAPPEVREAGGG